MMALLYCLVLFLVYFCTELCCAIDSISTTQFLQDPKSIVSTNGTFRLGFFSPQHSTNRYVGIWFNKVPVQTVVWVANRNKPIKDSLGVLIISDDGNLQLKNGQKVIIWSTNVSSSTIRNTTAQLLDSGNLVLQQSNSNTSAAKRIWQSFDHPTNTFLPGMKPTVLNTRNKRNVIFQSWSSVSDPSEGSFTVGIGTTGGIPQVFTWKDGINFWRSGPFDRNNFIGLPNADKSLNDGFILEEKGGTLDMSFEPNNGSALFNYVMEPNGTVIEQYWDGTKNIWVPGWIAPEPATKCAVYGTCGPYGSCDHSLGICKCLRGFRPKNDQEWRKGNTSSGCVRRTELQCRNQDGNEDRFWKMHTMKVPSECWMYDMVRRLD